MWTALATNNSCIFVVKRRKEKKKSTIYLFCDNFQFDDFCPTFPLQFGHICALLTSPVLMAGYRHYILTILTISSLEMVAGNNLDFFLSYSLHTQWIS
jgi:hypothetical protein